MSEPLLSILICTLPKREYMFRELVVFLSSQVIDFDEGAIEILFDDSEVDSIGEKRNRLMGRAKGKWLCAIDDDDKVSSNYIKLLLEATESDCDCASLKGEITIDGGIPEIFEHSIKYNEWKTNPKGSDIRHERFPNHLNLVKASIAKQFQFPEKNFSEDFDWSTELHNSGLLRIEHYIPDVIYFYNFISNK